MQPPPAAFPAAILELPGFYTSGGKETPKFKRELGDASRSLYLVVASLLVVRFPLGTSKRTKTLPRCRPCASDTMFMQFMRRPPFLEAASVAISIERAFVPDVPRFGHPAKAGEPGTGPTPMIGRWCRLYFVPGANLTCSHCDRASSKNSSFHFNSQRHIGPRPLQPLQNRTVRVSTFQPERRRYTNR